MRLGNDTADLRRLAQVLSDGSNRLTEASITLESLVGSLRWTGRDFDEFARRMRSTVHPLLVNQARHLEDAAALILAQAAAQTVVSSPDPLHPEPPGPARNNRFTQVLQFDPTGDGRVVVALGDVASARHIAVLVPGAGSSIGNFPTQINHATDLLDALAGTSEPSAVIAWLGYDAPAGLTSVTGLNQVLMTQRADRGADRLETFLAGLPRASGSTVTVIGHSYGSLVAAKAAAGNADVDALVVLGSPGLGVASVSGLGLARGTRFYAAATLGDAISHTEWFGPDPASPGFGAAVLDTGTGIGPRDGIGTAHSSYFEPTSVSLTNLAAVVAGRRPRLEHPSLADRSFDLALDGFGVGAGFAGAAAAGPGGETIARGVAHATTSFVSAVDDEFRRVWRRLNSAP